MKKLNQSAMAGGADRVLPDRGRSPTERELLWVLWASPGEPLVRAEIHRRMPALFRPTPGRVSQILKALDCDGLLKVFAARSQGSPKASFFKLSPLGVRLCRHLGFDQETLFRVSEDDLSRYLTREHLANRPEQPPGPVVAFHGQREGLGRTTAVGNVARGLAEREPKQGVLVLDLHLSDSVHPGFFGSGTGRFGSGTGRTCRGLHGLVVDYQSQPSWNQAGWLKDALAKPEYVDRPLSDLPNLFYLPTGLPQEPGGRLLTGEWAETLAFLRRSLARDSFQLGANEAGTSKVGFFQRFRSALVERFRRAVIDSQAGETLGAAIAIHTLADDLAVCVRLPEQSSMIGRGIQSTIARFYRCREARGEEIYGPLFISLMGNRKFSIDVNSWISEIISTDNESDQAAKSCRFRIARIDYDPRIDKDPRRQDRSVIYKGIVAQLEEPNGENFEAPSTEMQALLQVLDVNVPYHRRSVLTGFLANTPSEKLLRCLREYSASQKRRPEIDQLGVQLIHNMARTKLQQIERLGEEIEAEVRRLTDDLSMDSGRHHGGGK